MSLPALNSPGRPTLYDHNGRLVANSQFFTATKYSRDRTWIPSYAVDSKHTLTKFTRSELMGLARYIATNVGLARGVVHDKATYSVGTGLIPQSQCPNPQGADELETFFDAWGRQADASGKHSFGTLQHLACQAIDVDGDIGFSMFAPEESSWGQLQTIEGHRITSEGAEAGEGNWIDGVKVDRMGRQAEFRVSEGDDQYRPIPARDFIFLYDPDRLDQVRGYTAFVHAITHFRDVADITAYEKVGVKMSSAIGIAIKTMNGTADSGSSYIETGYRASDTGGLAQQTFEAGMVPRLKLGESIESFGSNRPSPAFVGFIEFLLRDIAVGLGLPFEFVWDLAAAKGSGSRFILAKAQRCFEQRQALLVQRFLNRCWFWSIGKAIKRGDLRPWPRWWEVRWQAPAKITVDMGREAQANRDDLKYGNRTLQEDAAERGLDWETDIRRQREREARDLVKRAVALQKEFDRDGMTLDKALFLLSADSPNAPTLTVTTRAE